MVQKYDDNDLAPLKAHFPAHRESNKTVFEIAIAATGGTSTGAYIAGVLDFLWEALEEWTAAKAAGDAPDHEVRVTTLVGTSAGGLSVSLAAMAGVREFPHVYDERVWQAMHPNGPPQDRAKNPLYRAWVKEISLDRLLSKPEDAKTGELALFYSAPKDIRDTIFKMIAAAPVAANRTWLADPLDLRVAIGNLRGVPYGLDFNNPAAVLSDATADAKEWSLDQRLLLHRDHVAFAVPTGAAQGRPTGLGDPPDTHHLDATRASRDPRWAPPETPPGDLVEDSGWTVFSRAVVATSAIPLVFRTEQVLQDPFAYDWRMAYWNGTKPIIDRPLWGEKVPSEYIYTATDGGLYDDAPFDLARRRLAGVRGHNPQDGKHAHRAVILIDPIFDELAETPADPTDDTPGQDPQTAENDKLLRVLARLLFAPIKQVQISNFDLAQIKDESIYSRYMISPSRRNPENPEEDWGPSFAMQTTPLSAFMGFTAEAYREHDFLLGRRNAQHFLRNTFTLPEGNPIVGDGSKWGERDRRRLDDGRYEYRIVPLRGWADMEQPEPVWNWRALEDSDIARLEAAFRKRADALFANVKRRFGGWFGDAVMQAAWTLFLRGKILKLFRKQLTDARDGLNPRDRKRSVRAY